MERQDLTATSFVTSRMVAVMVGAIGVFFVLRPRSLGWGWVVDHFGETNVLATGIGLVLLLLAAHSFEKHQLRVRAAELTEMLHQLLYGKNYAAEREMIDVLIGALERGDPSAHSHLTRLTGQHFAADPGVWRSWWNANRRHFELVRGAAEGVPPRHEDGEVV